MNQKIKQLADQAKNNVPAGLGVDQWIETYNQLFAELIVKECAGLMDGRRIEYGNCKDGRVILKHFGVEE
jgi:hypothetical protein